MWGDKRAEISATTFFGWTEGHGKSPKPFAGCRQKSENWVVPCSIRDQCAFFPILTFCLFQTWPVFPSLLRPNSAGQFHHRYEDVRQKHILSSCKRLSGLIKLLYDQIAQLSPINYIKCGFFLLVIVMYFQWFEKYVH